MQTRSTMFDSKKFSKYFLIISFVVSLITILWLVRSFILQVVLAVIVAILVFPLFRLLLKITGNRRSLSSMLCCGVVLFAVFLPLVFTAQLLIEQGMGLYRSAGAELKELISQGNAGLVGKIDNSWLGQWLSSNGILMDWESLSTKAINYLGTTLAYGVNTLSRTTITVFFDLFIILFSLFYFLRDGEQIMLRIKDIIPISDEYKERLVSRFYIMTNAIVKGIVFIALLQSFLATLTLWAFGIQGWMIWGVVMLVFSVVPFVGTGVVLVPAGIIKIMNGHFAEGVAIIIISVFFISMIDNVLRPKIVGQHAGMHNLLVFFSMIGGILSFGPAGLVVGPLIAAIFLTILEIYRIEFQSQIESMK